jgi:DNA-binding MarR family transcriptional regulator
MNRTKVEILKCLSDGQWRTSPQVAQECGLSLTNASELLRRYRAQSLLVRVRNPGVPRGYLYALTDAGLERLRYLSSGVVATSSVLADLAGLSGSKKRVFDQWVKQKIGG